VAAVVPEPVAVDASHPVAFDPSVLEALPMVADGSEPEFAGQVLAQYLDSSAQTIDACERALAAGDVRVVLRGVHTLKSSSAQVGALALAALAGDLEGRMRVGEVLDAGGIARLRALERVARTAIMAHLDRSALTQGVTP